MTLLAHVWPKVCKKLVKLFVIPEEISQYRITEDQDDHGETILEVFPNGDKYKFNLAVSTNLENGECESSDDPVIIIEDENIRIKIKSCTIDGYQPCTLEEMNDSNAIHLKSLLTALAHNHSRSIESQINVNDRNSYSLVRDDFKKILSILYEVMEKKGSDETDGSLFSRGVEKLYYSSEEALKSKKHIYVESYILQSDLFFQLSDSGVVKCKIINFVTNGYVPLVYEVLLCIFFYSTSKTRQHHFHKLLNFYYNTLTENMHQVGFNLSDILPFDKYLKLIYRFSPYAKLEVALLNCRRYLKPLNILEDSSFVSNFWNLFDSDEHLKYIWKCILEIYYAVLYTNLSREDCYKIIRHKIGSSDYKFLSWKVVPLEKRSGYLGDYFKLTTDIKLKEEVKSLNLFAKCFPTYNKSVEEMARVAFEKEEYFYVTFIPQANELGLKDITNFQPKCYFSRSDEVLVFEDMSVLNYRSLSPSEPLSYETALLVTRQLAKLHACSLLYEEIMTEKLGELYRIDDKSPKFVEEAFLALEQGQPIPIVSCGISATVNYLLDAFPDVPKMFTLEEFKKKVKDLYGKMIPSRLKSTKYRNVVCQGDPWGNNFLFKRDVHDTPIECCILDYQLIRYCPPSHDLLFFIYLNTDKKTRDECMSKIIEQYYMELTKIFKEYNYDVSKIYTYDTFLECCECVKAEAIALATIYLQLVLYPPEKMENLLRDQEKFDYVIVVDRKEILDELYDNHNIYYRQRLKEIVEELYEACESS